MVIQLSDIASGAVTFAAQCTMAAAHEGCARARDVNAPGGNFPPGTRLADTLQRAALRLIGEGFDIIHASIVTLPELIAEYKVGQPFGLTSDVLRQLYPPASQRAHRARNPGGPPLVWSGDIQLHPEPFVEVSSQRFAISQIVTPVDCARGNLEAACAGNGVVRVTVDLASTFDLPHAVHELFHLVQEAYCAATHLPFDCLYGIRTGEIFTTNGWILEGTADAVVTAVQNSDNLLVSSPDARNWAVPLNCNLDGISPEEAYYASEFWRYVGWKSGRGMSYLKDFFSLLASGRNGPGTISYADVDSALISSAGHSLKALFVEAAAYFTSLDQYASLFLRDPVIGDWRRDWQTQVIRRDGSIRTFHPPDLQYYKRGEGRPEDVPNLVYLPWPMSVHSMVLQLDDPPDLPIDQRAKAVKFWVESELPDNVALVINGRIAYATAPGDDEPGGAGLIVARPRDSMWDLDAVAGRKLFFVHVAIASTEEGVLPNWTVHAKAVSTYCTATLPDNGPRDRDANPWDVYNEEVPCQPWGPCGDNFFRGDDGSIVPAGTTSGRCCTVRVVDPVTYTVRWSHDWNGDPPGALPPVLVCEDPQEMGVRDPQQIGPSGTVSRCWAPVVRDPDIDPNNNLFKAWLSAPPAWARTDIPVWIHGIEYFMAFPPRMRVTYATIEVLDRVSGVVKNKRVWPVFWCACRFGDLMAPDLGHFMNDEDAACFGLYATLSSGVPLEFRQPTFLGGCMHCAAGGTIPQDEVNQWRLPMADD